MIPFLKTLQNNQSLRELDISSNHIGDAAFLLLCNYLTKNSTLTALNFDDNKLSTNGFLAFRGMLNFNLTLSCIEFPVLDLPKEEKGLKVYSEIQKITFSRKPGSFSPNMFKFNTPTYQSRASTDKPHRKSNEGDNTPKENAFLNSR